MQIQQWEVIGAQRVVDQVLLNGISLSGTNQEVDRVIQTILADAKLPALISGNQSSVLSKKNHYVPLINVMTVKIDTLITSFILFPRKPYCPSFSWMYTGGVSAALDRPCFLWWGALSGSGQQWQVDSPCPASFGLQTFVGPGSAAHKEWEEPSSGGMHQANERTEAFWGTLRYTAYYVSLLGTNLVPVINC